MMTAANFWLKSTLHLSSNIDHVKAYIDLIIRSTTSPKLDLTKDSLHLMKPPFF